MGKKLAEMLWKGEFPDGELVCGQWLMFADERGRGFAQPDAWIEFPHFVLIVEAKLTQTDKAVEQLQFLYAPLVGKLLGKPLLLLEVAKYLRHERRVISSPLDLLNKPRDGVWTWQYLD